LQLEAWVIDMHWLLMAVYVFLGAIVI